jgi:hypothetical protein
MLGLDPKIRGALMVTGTCLCGAIAWTASGPYELMSHCHCSMCRKAHGASFATAVGAPLATFRFDRGEEHVVAYASSAANVRSFCARCGSTVPRVPDSGERIFLPAGSLDVDPGVRPIAHIFVASKAPWHTITDALPRFAAYPPGWGDDLPQAPPADPTPRAEGGVRGSCLCGQVAFEAAPPFGPMTNCHCSRCRKMVSAAYATDFRAPAAGFRWLRGRDQVRDFVLPGAKWFMTSFCATCGSVLPHVARNDPSAVLVQAGALDDDPGLRPTLHLFVASKAPWNEIDDGLPQWAEYPPSR